MAKRVVNTRLLLEMNADFRKAVERGELWALQHLDKCERLNNGEVHAFDREPDGKPRRWCDGCPFPEGCVTCTLP